MKEFVITSGIGSRDFTVISENFCAANRALFQYLTNRGYRICVLKHQVANKTRIYDIMDDHFIIIGKHDYFTSWMKEAYEAGNKKTVFKYADSLDDEVVAEWVRDYMPKEMWTFHVSKEYYDEFFRSGPTIRNYNIVLRHFATVSPEQENNPENKEYKEAGYLSATVKKEEERW